MWGFKDSSRHVAFAAVTDLPTKKKEKAAYKRA